MRTLNDTRIEELVNKFRSKVEFEFKNDIDLLDRKDLVLSVSRLDMVTQKSKIVKVSDDENDYYLGLLNFSNLRDNNICDKNFVAVVGGLSCKRNSLVVSNQMFELETKVNTLMNKMWNDLVRSTLELE